MSEAVGGRGRGCTGVRGGVGLCRGMGRRVCVSSSQSRLERERDDINEKGTRYPSFPSPQLVQGHGAGRFNHQTDHPDQA